MRPSFQPDLVNGMFGDPVLYVDFVFERRALLFDVGDVRRLSTRKLLRISDVFISHAHMDHFNDFDWLLRLFIGRNRMLRVFGPAGFIEHVAHKLGAYSWNLVQNYADDLVIIAHEQMTACSGQRARFRCQTRFQIEKQETFTIKDRVLLDDPAFRVRSVILDHDIPCLAFCMEEKQHVNVWKNRLEELGLPVGPWLRELKQAVFHGLADNTMIRVWWRQHGRSYERFLTLGYLKEHVLRIVPGQRIGYLVDALYSPANFDKARELLRACDVVFIESAFLDEDAAIAARRNHLTARQAGLIARAAGAKRIFPMHFSARYSDRGHLLKAEAEAAFAR